MAAGNKLHKILMHPKVFVEYTERLLRDRETDQTSFGYPVTVT